MAQLLLCRVIDEISAVVVVEPKENAVRIGPRHTCTWNMCKCLLRPQYAGGKRKGNFGGCANEVSAVETSGIIKEAGTLANRAGMQAGAHRTITM